MGSMRAAAALVVIASSASAQSSLAACGDPPDSTARQTIVSAGNLKVCLLAMRSDPADSTPRRWATRSHMVILETQLPSDFRRLALDRGTAWTINGKTAAFDSTAESWQRAVIDVLDAAWATRRLAEMADGLQATTIPVPTNRDSLKARLTGVDKQITLLTAKIKWAEAELAQAQRAANGSPSATRTQSGPERALLDAMVQHRRLQDEMQVLTARKDLLQLQLERLDTSNPRTIARQSMVDEVSTRLAAAEAEFHAAFSRLREILAR
jgi:hypothetical protein